MLCDETENVKICMFSDFLHPCLLKRTCFAGSGHLPRPLSPKADQQLSHHVCAIARPLLWTFVFWNWKKKQEYQISFGGKYEANNFKTSMVQCMN
jgi:hypothetical protein